MYNQKYDDSTSGKNIKLPHKYSIWIHDLHGKKWGIDSYKKIYDITNVADFWKVFNNFSKLGLKHMHFFIMKDDIEPTWEHVENRNGGLVSYKIEIDQSAEVWETLACRMVCETLGLLENDINGISFSPKNNWGIIKIWNKNFNEDVSQVIDNDIIHKYGADKFRCKANVAEY